MAVKTYMLKDVTVLFGPVILQGSGPDEKVRIEYNEDAWTLQKGADGHTTRSRTENDSARVTVLLAQTSDTNALLSAIEALDRKVGQGVFPLTIKHGNNGRSLHFAEQAWIVRPPNIEYGAEAGVIEWTFETGDLDGFAGGVS